LAKVRNPSTLSGYFGVDHVTLERLDVHDPTLAIDTKLFIDPLLLKYSQHQEICDGAVEQYRSHFEKVITFLTATKVADDVAWRSARRLLEFHEIRGTCLGYGANTIQGSGFGPELTDRILHVGKEIVDLGIRDPDLFPSMALFEADIGPDRISDMATNVMRSALVNFNHRVLDELSLEGERFELGDIEGHFLRKPFQSRRTPIILIPRDILRKLPIAMDWDGVADAASQNAALRHRVNEHLGQIWAAKTKRTKNELREQALTSRDAFQALLDAIHDVPPRAYDTVSDPDGLVKWARLGKHFADQYPLTIKTGQHDDTLEALYHVAKQIVTRFRQLIEHNGLNRELYKESRAPRHESTAQKLFFAIAFCYWEANDLDISPEVDSGSGQVDFKLSRGFDVRILVEVKLSTNGKLVSGYEKQIEAYKQAEQTMRAIYLIVDVGRMGKKDERLFEVRKAAQRRGSPLSDLEFVDGRIKPSASKRK